MAKPRVTTAIRFDPETHAALTAAADEREVSMNWLVNRIVKEGIDRLRPAASLFLDAPREGGTAAEADCA